MCLCAVVVCACLYPFPFAILPSAFVAPCPFPCVYYPHPCSAPCHFPGHIFLFAVGLALLGQVVPLVLIGGIHLPATLCLPCVCFFPFHPTFPFSPSSPTYHPHHYCMGGMGWVVCGDGDMCVCVCVCADNYACAFVYVPNYMFLCEMGVTVVGREAVENRQWVGWMGVAGGRQGRGSEAGWGNQPPAVCSPYYLSLWPGWKAFQPTSDGDVAWPFCGQDRQTAFLPNLANIPVPLPVFMGGFSCVCWMNTYIVPFLPVIPASPLLLPMTCGALPVLGTFPVDFGLLFCPCVFFLLIGWSQPCSSSFCITLYLLWTPTCPIIPHAPTHALAFCLPMPYPRLCIADLCGVILW